MSEARDRQLPPRPEWVQRLNEEGACMNIRGVVPLDENSLIEAAMRDTGLADFGDDQWREPFAMLVHSLENEAELNLMGRLRLRAELLMLLMGRLRVEEAYSQHPEIEDGQVVEPIIVAGQTRTGSSFLINLLASNPEDGALLHWEAISPCPPPETASYHSDPRIPLADRWITQCTRVAPTLESMHEFSATLSIECCQLIAMSFRSDGWFGFLANVPGYQAYLAQQDPTLGLRYHKRVLKLLQWRNPRRHWVLKENANLFKLPAMFAVYPDACFVWSHRDPIRAVASAKSIVATMHWCGTDDPLKGGVLDTTTDPETSAAVLNVAIDQMESGAVPVDRFHHVHYKDLVRDPLGTVAKLYAHFNIPFDDRARAAIADYLTANPRDARPAHKLAITDEAIAEARGFYARYENYFGIERE